MAMGRGQCCFPFWLYCLILIIVDWFGITSLRNRSRCSITGRIRSNSSLRRWRKVGLLPHRLNTWIPRNLRLKHTIWLPQSMPESIPYIFLSLPQPRSVMGLPSAKNCSGYSALTTVSTQILISSNRTRQIHSGRRKVGLLGLPHICLLRGTRERRIRILGPKRRCFLREEN